jgi:hypothetical protein
MRIPQPARCGGEHTFLAGQLYPFPVNTPQDRLISAALVTLSKQALADALEVAAAELDGYLEGLRIPAPTMRRLIRIVVNSKDTSAWLLNGPRHSGPIRS